MSVDAVGPEAKDQIAQLAEFAETVDAYSLARQQVMTYETSKNDHPEAFTIVDQEVLTQRHVAQFLALQKMQAQALILHGCGVLQRCIKALEAQPDG